MDEALGRELVLGNRVIHEASGFTGEVRKTYAWGVEVWVPALGNSREIWSWPMITVRTPRIIKRYPRPFRWPREIPTEQCHCKIGRMEVEGENQVRCTRCKKLVGNEAFPARFRRASQFLRKAYPDQKSKTQFSPRVERPRRRKTPRIRPKRKASHRVGVRPSRRGKAATRYGKSKRPSSKGQRGHRPSLPKARKGRPPSLSTSQARKA